MRMSCVTGATCIVEVEIPVPVTLGGCLQDIAAVLASISFCDVVIIFHFLVCKFSCFHPKNGKIVFLFRISTIKMSNLPICLRSAGFKFVLRIKYCLENFNVLHELISRFSQNLFFRDFASPPLIGGAMRYADVPQASYLAAYLLSRKGVVNSGEAVEIELRAVVYSQQRRHFELHSVDVFRLAHTSPSSNAYPIPSKSHALMLGLFDDISPSCAVKAFSTITPAFRKLEASTSTCPPKTNFALILNVFFAISFL
nr:MAG TPA: hypothetical protein [Caudoviricetes sp.]